MHKSDDDCPEVLRNIWKLRQVWGSLGKLLQWEGADPIVLEKFYRVVTQEVLIFGADTWVLTAEISQKLEGVSMGFLRQVKGQKSQWL